MIKWNVTTEDRDLIDRITERAVKLAEGAGVQVKRMDLAMDITAAHANDRPLKLAALLEADDFEFAHDVFGINRHLDRTTGRLMDCFLPRFAAL